MPAFLTALAGEAEDGLQRLMELERAWFAARRAVADRRRHSRAPAAVDLLAAAPLLSAASLAAGLGMAVTNAAALLDRFCAENIAVEVTHRSKRRLFGLSGLAPLRNGVAPPRRPEPGRGRGRPRLLPVEDAAPPPPLPPVAPLTASRAARLRLFRDRSGDGFRGGDRSPNSAELGDLAIRPVAADTRRAVRQRRRARRTPADRPMTATVSGFRAKVHHQRDDIE